MSPLARVLWIAFFISVAVAIFLPSPSPPSRIAKSTWEYEESPGSEKGIEKNIEEAEDSPADFLAEIALMDDGDENEDPEKPPSGTPQEFLERILNIAEKGELDFISGRFRPGAARLAGDLVNEIFFSRFLGEKKEMGSLLKDLKFDFEELPGGLVRLHVQGPGGTAPPEKIFLVPDGDSWTFAAESDLPGPGAASRRAVCRLRLLGLCRQASIEERLEKGASGRADSARAIAEELENSPFYEGVLDPALAAAVDDRFPLDGYIFGRIEMRKGDPIFFATPAAYGEESRETIFIDGAGDVWSKDLGGEHSPFNWPGPEPYRQGWSKKG